MLTKEDYVPKYSVRKYKQNEKARHDAYQLLTRALVISLRDGFRSLHTRFDLCTDRGEDFFVIFHLHIYLHRISGLLSGV